MIQRSTHCFACLQRKATRTVTISGVDLPMCSDCPSPSEIVERAALVRQGWDDVEYEARRLDCPRPLVEYTKRVYADERVCVLVYPPKVASY